MGFLCSVLTLPPLQVSLPTAEISSSLAEYTDLICGKYCTAGALPRPLGEGWQW